MIGKWHMGHGEGHDPDNVDHWEVLPGQGDYWGPAVHQRRRPPPDPRATPPTSSPTSRSSGADQTGRARAVVRAGVAQGPAPGLGTQARPPGAVRGTAAAPTARSGTTTTHAPRRSAAPRCGSPITSTCRTSRKNPPGGSRLRGGGDPGSTSGTCATTWRVSTPSTRTSGASSTGSGDRGDFDDTMLIYSSDQGFFLGDHGWFDKRLMFEESLRMPFLVSYPNGIDAGQVHDGIVSNVDMAQTNPRRSRGRAPRAHAGPELLARPAPRCRRPRARGRRVLPLLGERRLHPPGTGPLRLPDRPLQADLLLQRQLRAAVHTGRSNTRPNGSSTTSKPIPTSSATSPAIRPTRRSRPT